MPQQTYTYAPLALTLIWVLFFIARTLWVWRTTGENPNKVKNDDSIMSFCGRIYGVVYILSGGFILGRVFWPVLDVKLGRVAYFSHESITWLGLVVMLVATLFSLYAQTYMAKSWRIGVPDADIGEKPGELVSGGPFRISRNPFFLGMILYYIGIFFMLPNALTFACLLTLWASLNVQIRLEEAFLEETIGEPYSKFKASVRRWV